MTTNEKITSLFAQNNGILEMAKAMEGGVPKSASYAYAKKHGIERVVQGAYPSPGAQTDTMYLLYLRCNQAVSSHESALFLHGLTDREPKPYSVTVKTGYNSTGLREDGIKVYTIKKELHGVGAIPMNTSFGDSVPVYDVERTIRDVIRNRSGTGIQIWQNALKRYVKCQHKDLRKLMHYARMFHVEELPRQYSEALL